MTTRPTLQIWDMNKYRLLPPNLVFGGGFFVLISEEPVSFTSGIVQMEKLSYNNSNSTNA